ncbi:hypothetical protein E2320_003145, partial [Naja naja]
GQLLSNGKQPGDPFSIRSLQLHGVWAGPGSAWGSPGNTTILKPARSTGLAALFLAEVCTQAGLPPGVFNVLTGDQGLGDALAHDPGVDKVAFVGTAKVGRCLRQATAGSGKKLCLQLGGKLPFIVFDSADLDSAVDAVVDAIWLNRGQ